MPNLKDKSPTPARDLVLANERIRDPQVRLVGNSGENHGVVPTREALMQARQLGLDLVVINQQSNPMVAKFLDLGKYLYDLKRDTKERARKSRESEILIKEIQLRPVTDAHDIEIKARAARGFLQDGNKVKVVIKFRGREMSHTALGFEVVGNFLSAVGPHGFEREPSMMGRSILAILTPGAAAKTVN
jgi:translation initiation factor IF-3